jgi:hypothetical protein
MAKGKTRVVYVGGKPHRWNGYHWTMGDDAEFIEATKPRGFAPAYYEGGFRMVIGGAPIRMAAHVKDWSPWMKRALGRGTQVDGLGDAYEWKADHELRRQLDLLFPGAEARREARRAANENAGEDSAAA